MANKVTKFFDRLPRRAFDFLSILFMLVYLPIAWAIIVYFIVKGKAHIGRFGI